MNRNIEDGRTIRQGPPNDLQDLRGLIYFTVRHNHVTLEPALYASSIARKHRFSALWTDAAE